jgi:molecular chaperone GrpE
MVMTQTNNTENTNGSEANSDKSDQSNKEEQPQGTEPDWQQKYVYLYAEFENFKKRAFKERQDAIKYAIEGPAAALLEVLDNFERALQFAKPDADPNLVEGLKMVMTQFKSTLEKQNVVEVPAMGQPFNPELHEAVGQIASEHPTGHVAQCHQKGYSLHGRLIRPARVLVSTGPQTPGTN